MKWFEEYVQVFDDGRNPKFLGIRLLDKAPAGRALGADGRQLVTLTSPLTLKRSAGPVTVKASPSKPVQAWTIVYALT